MLSELYLVCSIMTVTFGFLGWGMNLLSGCSSRSFGYVCVLMIGAGVGGVLTYYFIGA